MSHDGALALGCSKSLALNQSLIERISLEVTAPESNNLENQFGGHKLSSFFNRYKSSPQAFLARNQLCCSNRFLTTTEVLAHMCTWFGAGLYATADFEEARSDKETCAKRGIRCTVLQLLQCSFTAEAHDDMKTFAKQGTRCTV
jgi:hypothetical protein